MKKSFVFGICLALFMSCSAFAKDNIKIFIDSNEISVSQPPVIQNGRTLVPLRGVAENLNCNVNWNGETKTVVLTKNDTVIKLQINHMLVNVTDSKNTYDVLIDSPAILLNGTTMVPIRTIAELFDAKVNWDNQNKIVYIESPKAAESNTNNNIPNIPVLPNYENSEEKEPEVQSLRKLSAKIDDDNNLNISFLPDTENNYDVLAEEINIYFYNRLGDLIYQELGEGVTIRSNNDFIEYKLLCSDILNETDNTTFTTYTNCTVKVEITSGGKVYASGEHKLGYVFSYSSGYNADGLNMNIQCEETSSDNRNQIKTKFRFYGTSKKTQNNNLYIVCYDIRDKKIGQIPLGVVIGNEEFDFDQYYTLPSATSKVTIETK